MGLSVQYWPRWFHDFPAILLAVPFGWNGAHLGICTLPEKNLLCVWNKLFLGEIKFSSCEEFMVFNCPYAGTNKWMEKSHNSWNNGKTSNSGVLIDEKDIEILEIFQNLKNIARFNLKLFYQE